MSAQDRFERTLTLLHRAAMADARWVSAAASINSLTRASGHSLGYGELRPGGDPEVFLARSFSGRQRRKDWEDLYFSRYWGQDEAFLRLGTLRVGELAHKADLYTDREKKTSPVYNDFSAPHPVPGRSLHGARGAGRVRDRVVVWPTPFNPEAGATTRFGTSSVWHPTYATSRASGA